jgi:hypothetical protein
MRDHGREFINPYLQAEHIPPEVIELQEVPKRDIIARLWKTIELGITTQDKQRVLDTRQEARKVSYDKKQESSVRISAAMLHANATLLAQRADVGPTTREDILSSFRSMGRVLARVQMGAYGQAHESQYSGWRSEILNYCLVAYAGDEQFIPYLGSRREENSYLRIANHDIYTLPNKTNASKVAGQVKHTFHAKARQQLGTPDDPRHTFMFPIYAREVLQQKATEMGITSKDREGIREAARLVIACAMNRNLSEQQTRYLQGFSASILGLFVEHRDHLRQKTKLHKMPYTTAATPKEFIAGLQ